MFRHAFWCASPEACEQCTLLPHLSAPSQPNGTGRSGKEHSITDHITVTRVPDFPRISSAPCGQRRHLWFVSVHLSLLSPILLFFFQPIFRNFCFSSSVDGTSVSKRPSRQAICDPSSLFGGGVSLCIYTYIYVHSHMYIYVYMRADGGKGVEF